MKRKIDLKKHRAFVNSVPRGNTEVSANFFSLNKSGHVRRFSALEYCVYG